MTSLIYPATNLKQIEQLIIDRSDGVYVYDTNGNQYLEGLAGLWCTSLGYGNLELVDAATDAMSRLSFTHMFGGKSHQLGIDLAEKLASIVQPRMRRYFSVTPVQMRTIH